MRADHDRRRVTLGGKVDDRVGHVHLVRNRMGLGIEPHGTSKPGTLSGDHRGVMLPGLVNLRHKLRIRRDRDGSSGVQTGHERRRRAQPGLPNRDYQRSAAREQLGSATHRGVRKIRAVVRNQQPRVPPRHGP